MFGINVKRPIDLFGWNINPFAPSHTPASPLHIPLTVNTRFEDFKQRIAPISIDHQVSDPTDQCLKKLIDTVSAFATFAMLDAWAAGRPYNGGLYRTLTDKVIQGNGASCWHIFKIHCFDHLSTWQKIQTALAYFFLCYTTGMIHNGIECAAHQILSAIRTRSQSNPEESTFGDLTKEVTSTFLRFLKGYEAAFEQYEKDLTDPYKTINSYKTNAINRLVEDKTLQKLALECSQLIVDTFSLHVELFSQWKQPQHSWVIRGCAHLGSGLLEPLLHRSIRYALQTKILPLITTSFAQRGIDDSYKTAVAKFFTSQMETVLNRYQSANSLTDEPVQNFTISDTSLLPIIATYYLIILKWENKVLQPIPRGSLHLGINPKPVALSDRVIETLSGINIDVRLKEGLGETLTQISLFTLNYLNNPKNTETIVQQLLEAIRVSHQPMSTNPREEYQQALHKWKTTVDVLVTHIAKEASAKTISTPQENIRREVSAYIKRLQDQGLSTLIDCLQPLEQLTQKIQHLPDQELLTLQPELQHIYASLRQWMLTMKHHPIPEEEIGRVASDALLNTLQPLFQQLDQLVDLLSEEKDPPLHRAVTLWNQTAHTLDSILTLGLLFHDALPSLETFLKQLPSLPKEEWSELHHKLQHYTEQIQRLEQLTHILSQCSQLHQDATHSFSLSSVMDLFRAPYSTRLRKKALEAPLSEEQQQSLLTFLNTPSTTVRDITQEWWIIEAHLTEQLRALPDTIEQEKNALTQYWLESCVPLLEERYMLGTGYQQTIRSILLDALKGITNQVITLQRTVKNLEPSIPTSVTQGTFATGVGLVTGALLTAVVGLPGLFMGAAVWGGIKLKINNLTGRIKTESKNVCLETYEFLGNQQTYEDLCKLMLKIAIDSLRKNAP